MVIIAAVGGPLGVPLQRARLAGVARWAFAWAASIASVPLAGLLARAEPPAEETRTEPASSGGEGATEPPAATTVPRPAPDAGSSPAEPRPTDPAAPEAAERRQAAAPDPAKARSSVWPWPNLPKHPPETPPGTAPKPPGTGPESPPPPPPPTVLVVHRRPEGKAPLPSPKARGPRFGVDPLDDALAPRTLRNAIDDLLGNIVDKRDEDRGKGSS